MKARKLLALLLVLAMVLGAFCVSAFATTTSLVSVASGEMIAIDWTQSGTNYTGTVVDAYTLSSTTYTMPYTFVLWTRGTPTFTYDNTKISVSYLYDSADGQDKAYEVDVTNVAENTTSNLTVAITGGTYSVDLPAATAGATGASYPSYVNGYLPVGQYAAGASWGGIFSDGMNRTGSTTKFTVDGSGAVSLGACGGYIQFEFTNPIQNDPKNPYGVDFIVYGNAFSTNAEAGSVQVSNDGTTWYELAGSRYYKAETLRNVNVSYRLVTDQDNVQRVQYKVWDLTGPNNTENVYKDWDYLKQPTPSNPNTYPNTKGWWPMYDANTENYGVVSGVGTALRGTAAVNKAAWSDNNYTITFYGITLVEDEDNASEYTFGYADVHGNGTYGDASNPYAAGQNTAGGDGFDISWAVNSDGTPASLSSVKYVRVYTSAGLKYDATTGNPYIFVHDAFNETSTEVCGLYVANPSSANVGTSTNPTSVSFKYTGASGSHTIAQNAIPNNGGTITRINSIIGYANGASTLTVTVNATAGSNVFINGQKLTESSSGVFTGTINTPSSGSKLQVIVQDGTKEPYLFVIK